MGQAAGTAAALAVRQGVSPRRRDAQDVRAALQGQGVVLHERALPGREREREPGYRPERGPRTLAEALAAGASAYSGPG
jgi:hypothetical protein